MSAEATGWVFRFSPYRGATFAVHLAIADSVNDQHQDRFWMKQGRLAEKARVARGSVVVAIATMTEDGLLELVADRHTEGKPNEYRLVMPSDMAEVYGRTLSAEPTSLARPGDEGVRAEPTRGARPARNRKTTQEVTQTGTQPTRATAQADPLVLLAPEDQPPSFAVFWKAYPRGDGKPAAEAAWEKALKAAPPERIMEGLAAWLAYWTARDEPEFVPWAQKWLNQQQWFAEPPNVRGKSRQRDPLGPGSTTINDAWADVPSGRLDAKAVR